MAGLIDKLTAPFYLFKFYMKNSKKTPIISKQMQLFNEKHFKLVPLVKVYNE